MRLCPSIPFFPAAPDAGERLAGRVVDGLRRSNHDLLVSFENIPGIGGPVA
jgi:hypothetical protein